MSGLSYMATGLYNIFWMQKGCQKLISTVCSNPHEACDKTEEADKGKE